MKKPIYLYILGALSFISVLFRLQAAFLSSLQAMPVTQTTGDAAVDSVLKATADLAVPLHELQTSLISKLFAVILLAALIAVAVFLFKNEYKQAGWIYVVYLVLTLVEQAYRFMASRQIFAGVANEELRMALSQGMNLGFMFNLVVFAVFMGITLFNLLRKPKVDPTVGNQSGLI